MNSLQLVQIKCPISCALMFIDTLKKLDINNLIAKDITLGTMIAQYQSYEVIIQVDHLIGLDYNRGDYITSITINENLTPFQKDKLCVRALDNISP